jgi:hypothetical protein
MGWMSFHMSEPVKQWFTKDINKEVYEVLDIALVKRTTLYAAMLNKETGEVFCAVYLIRWSRGYYNFSYKPMSEFVGPCETECPMRIMKLLTPLNDTIDPNGWARDWRDKVMKHWETQHKLNTGSFLIKTKEPIEFRSGIHFSCFKREGKHYLAGELQANGVFASFTKVRINNLKYYDYELIPVTI